MSCVLATCRGSGLRTPCVLQMHSTALALKGAGIDLTDVAVIGNSGPATAVASTQPRRTESIVAPGTTNENTGMHAGDGDDPGREDSGSEAAGSVDSGQKASGSEGGGGGRDRREGDSSDAESSEAGQDDDRGSDVSDVEEEDDRGREDSEDEKAREDVEEERTRLEERRAGFPAPEKRRAGFPARAVPPQRKSGDWGAGGGPASGGSLAKHGRYSQITPGGTDSAATGSQPRRQPTIQDAFVAAAPKHKMGTKRGKNSPGAVNMIRGRSWAEKGAVDEGAKGGKKRDRSWHEEMKKKSKKTGDRGKASATRNALKEKNGRP